LNPTAPEPSSDDLSAFSNALLGNNDYLLRCYVKLYNSGKMFYVGGGNPVWQTACPYESTLAWTAAGGWEPPPGAGDIVEDPTHTPVPTGYPTFQSNAYDEPYTPKIYFKYRQLVSKGAAALTWSLVKTFS